MMRWLLLPLPSLLPVLIDWAYAPINRHWTAEMFGCGCPPVDGSWRLNANHVNALLWLVILTFCVGAHCRIAWERFGRWRGVLCGGRAGARDRVFADVRAGVLVLIVVVPIDPAVAPGGSGPALRFGTGLGAEHGRDARATF